MLMFLSRESLLNEITNTRNISTFGEHIKKLINVVLRCAGAKTGEMYLGNFGKRELKNRGSIQECHVP